MAQRTSEQVTLRLPLPLLEALEHEAERDRRPRAALIRNVLEDWVGGRPRDGERAAGTRATLG
jgi:predicted DNA-binding protein